ncbi:hypothetical protein K6119_11315 [Paracrocinitomix mangrovi]|uniref:hypothetical protein n=1 Tax=Paracrocinitomix mangrovi TaxID=2862509 RepID=UPI001C8DC6A1|nr:hypothetical protein [Paracrocinitomix mangrovi]UKN00323.1 hypothetical protein K6119_11315 [Paracrocinitomix mangrovi]
MRFLLFATFGIALLLISCSSDQQQNRRDYFYQIDEFKTPKVLVYEQENNPFGTQKQYFVIKQKSESALDIEIIQEELGTFQELTDEYTEKGVSLYSSAHYFPEGNRTEEEIIMNQIFSFDSDTIGNLKTQFQDKYTKEMVIDETFWIFKSYDLDSMNNEIMITEGLYTRERKLYDTSSYWHQEIPLEIIYTKGIGPTRITYNAGPKQTQLRYIKSITLSEFEKLQVTQ